MSPTRISATVFAVVTLAVMAFVPVSASAIPTGEQIHYTVIAEDEVGTAAAAAAITRAGGAIVSRNDDVGMFSVQATSAFAQAAIAAPELIGAATDRAIGQVPDAAVKRDAVEQEGARTAAGGNGKLVAAAAAGAEPLDSLQWNMAMVRANDAHAKQAGSRSVTVGIIDSGIDASHPDLAPNLDLALSRNFAPDMPDIDGPCEVPSCLDPVGQDDNGHGFARRGHRCRGRERAGPGGRRPQGDTGRAQGRPGLGLPVPRAGRQLVDVRRRQRDRCRQHVVLHRPVALQLHGQPGRLTRGPGRAAGHHRGGNRALNYAHDHRVTLVGSLGNNHEDLGHPRTDLSSPDYPPGTTYPRPIDNATCVDLPVEGPHVIGVSALGPSTAKADYSNYGVEQISVSAPGGYFRDFFGTPQHRINANQVLSTYPKTRLQQLGRVDAAGNVTPAGVAAGTIKDCNAAGVCGYYQYLQGTSMASPHAVVSPH